jgi:hypothetical protein
MQTFLVSPVFVQAARALDRQRLGKQRVEAKQILRALRGESKGWVNHPAVRMWRGHERMLIFYGITMSEEWIKRGYKDTLWDYFIALLDEYPDKTVPPWLGDWDFHLAHKSNLIRKDPEFYRPMWPDVPNDLPYIWPV